MTDLRLSTQKLAGWGRCPVQTCHVARPAKYRQLKAIAVSNIARGQGRSYGDAALNQDQTVILAEKLNRFLSFDKINGIITAEAGITLKEIINVIVPVGWFLPVTPGTQYATLGGCVAADVHGKNHLAQGSFSKHVISFELITANDETILCSPHQQTELFWATVSGMGLTGLIGTVTLKLMAISATNLIVNSTAHYSLPETLQQFNSSNDYQVAWLDGLNKDCNSIFFAGKFCGQSKQGEEILTRATLAQDDEVGRRWPLKLAALWLQPWLMRQYNHYYFKKNKDKNQNLTLPQFFYPLDRIKHWHLLYGKKGFMQYQCIFPEATALIAIPKLMQMIQQHHHSIYLAVIKKFGEQNQGLLSFATAGFTLALDIPYQGTLTLNLLQKCHASVVAHGGRVYLAKDMSLTPEHFRAMYPYYEAWLAIKKKVDPNNIFQSSLSRRLAIYA